LVEISRKFKSSRFTLWECFIWGK